MTSEQLPELIDAVRYFETEVDNQSDSDDCILHRPSCLSVAAAASLGVSVASLLLSDSQLREAVDRYRRVRVRGELVRVVYRSALSVTQAFAEDRRLLETVAERLFNTVSLAAHSLPEHSTGSSQRSPPDVEDVVEA